MKHKHRARWTMPLLVRADELREVGVSYADIARVLRLDHGVDATGESVAAALKLHMGRKPSDRRRQCWSGAASASSERAAS